MNEEDVLHTPCGHYSAIIRNERLPFASMCIDLENIILSEISQTEKTKTVFYCCFLGPHVRHMEVLRLGVEWELSCQPMAQPQQQQTLNPLSEARS